MMRYGFYAGILAIIFWLACTSDAFASFAGPITFSTTPAVVVKVGEWETFYIYPTIPDHMTCKNAAEDMDKCHDSLYKVGDDITITWYKDEVASHIYHRNETDPEFSRYGEKWMLVFVGSGYVGETESFNEWVAMNERTGEEWPVFELYQVISFNPPMPPDPK